MSDLIALGSLVISFFALYLSFQTDDYQKELNDKVLKPQLFLKSEEKQIFDYELVSLTDSFEIFESYTFDLNLINITDAKILDLVVKIDIRKNDSFFFFLKKSLEENLFISENDGEYSWNKVFPLGEKREEKIDIFSANEELTIDLPSIFVALLCGSMYFKRQGNESDFVVSFDLNISYKHAFSDEYIKISKIFDVKVDYSNEILQGPIISCESIIFNKK